MSLASLDSWLCGRGVLRIKRISLSSWTVALFICHRNYSTVKGHVLLVSSIIFIHKKKEILKCRTVLFLWLISDWSINSYHYSNFKSCYNFFCTAQKGSCYDPDLHWHHGSGWNLNWLLRWLCIRVTSLKCALFGVFGLVIIGCNAASARQSKRFSNLPVTFQVTRRWTCRNIWFFNCQVNVDEAGFDYLIVSLCACELWRTRIN